MIANALIIIGLISLGAIIGVFVMALAAREDEGRDQYRAGYQQGERNGYLTGWRAARRAWGGRRGKAEEVA